MFRIHHPILAAFAALITLTIASCGGSEDKPSTVAGDTAAASPSASQGTQATPDHTAAASDVSATTGDDHRTDAGEVDNDEKNDDDKTTTSPSSPQAAVVETPKAQPTTVEPSKQPAPAAETKPTPSPAPAQTSSPTPPSPTTTPSVSPSGGKAIFLQSKCDGCHAVSAQGIARTAPAPEGQEPPRDLSHAGRERDAAWIARWLQKKETVNGKKHIKGFKGSDEDLKTLAEWLDGMN